MKKKLIQGIEESPVHDWFGLSYAQYIAIPRTILHSMPLQWQKDFVKLMSELDDKIQWRRSGCYVKYKNKGGRFMYDNLCDYDKGRRVLSPEQLKELVEEHEERYKLNNKK